MPRLNPIPDAFVILAQSTSLGTYTARIVGAKDLSVNQESYAGEMTSHTLEGTLELEEWVAGEGFTLLDALETALDTARGRAKYLEALASPVTGRGSIAISQDRGEVETPILEDANGHVTITGDHTWADVAGWIASDPGAVDCFSYLGELLGAEPGDEEE